MINHSHNLFFISTSTPMFRPSIVGLRSLGDVDAAHRKVCVDHPSIYILPEADEFLQILPFTVEGCYRLGRTLKETHPLLFYAWVKYCTRSNHFSLYDLPVLFTQWQTWTHGSRYHDLMQEVYSHNPKEFQRIVDRSKGRIVQRILELSDPYDVALLLHCCNREHYACVRFEQDVWNVYEDGAWRGCDSDHLRYKLDVQVQSLIMKAILDSASLQRNIVKLSVIVRDLETRRKIMAYCRELFFDPLFEIDPFYPCL